MANASRCRALLVSEGSGGHLIPALQVAEHLALAGAEVRLWYAARASAPWAAALVAEMAGRVTAEAIEVGHPASVPKRLRVAYGLWQRAQACFAHDRPDVVAGFGGWISAPILLAARRQGIPSLVHEQNVQLGRANRWLSRCVDRVAVSFQESRVTRAGRRAVVTGLPVRPGIGEGVRAAAARQWGLEALRPTVLVLGGSQGSRAINQRIKDVMRAGDATVLRQWQWLHVTGAAEVEGMRAAYAAAGLTAHVTGFIADMAAAYAMADAAVARAGASTIAELARCGLPAILIPYPHAQGHQRANAQLAEAAGGAIVLEEDRSGPQQVFDALAAILTEPPRRERMAAGMRTLDSGDAAQRLSRTLLQLAHEESTDETLCLTHTN